jgi:hypothetical protein
VTTATAICCNPIADNKPYNAKLCGNKSCKSKYNYDRNRRRTLERQATDPKRQRQQKRSAEFETWQKVMSQLKPQCEPVRIQCKRKGYEAWMVVYPDECKPELFAMKRHHGVWQLHYAGKLVTRQQRDRWCSRLTVRIKRV